MVTAAQLQRIASPASSAWVSQYAIALNETMAAHEMTTPARQAAFLAHALIGSGDNYNISTLGDSWTDLSLNPLADEHAFIRICHRLGLRLAGIGLALHYWDRAAHVLGGRPVVFPTFGEEKCLH